MAAPKFTIEYTDGSTGEVKLLPKAQLAYESETGKSLRDEVSSLTEMYQLAWFAAGKPEGSLEAWIEKVEALLPVEDEEEDAPRPTSRSKSRA